MTSKSVTIHTDRGHIKVRGYPLKYLAVTPWVDSECNPRSGDWVITHRSTGMLLSGSYWPFREAMRLAKKLDALDWSGVKSNRSRKALAILKPQVAAHIAELGD